MGYEKPITELEKQRANELYRYMKAHGTVTKDEICRLFSLSNERTARDLIKLVAVKVPVISTSDAKGYRLAKTEQDLADVEHTAAELSSRMEELERRLAPLYKFRDKVKFGIG